MAEQPTAAPTSIEATYEESNFFRVIHSDGMFGGPSPRGLLNIAFYSERTALPTKTRVPLVDGMPQAEVIVAAPVGVTRELEVNVIMDLPVAASFYTWLGGRLEELRVALKLTDAQLLQMKGGVK